MSNQPEILQESQISLSKKERAKIAQKKYRDKNKAKTKATWDLWYSKNKEAVIAKRKKRYQLNIAQERADALTRRNLNKTLANKRFKLWAKSNREHINNYRKARKESDPSFKIGLSFRRRLHSCITDKRYKAFDLLGCSLDNFKVHLESLFKSGMSWSNYGRQGWHIDHIKPVASFDLTKEEDQKVCFHYSNMQPLWAIENIKKGKKVYGE